MGAFALATCILYHHAMRVLWCPGRCPARICSILPFPSTQDACPHVPQTCLHRPLPKVLLPELAYCLGWGQGWMSSAVWDVHMSMRPHRIKDRAKGKCRKEWSVGADGEAFPFTLSTTASSSRTF